MLQAGPMPGDFIPLMGMVTGIVSVLVVGFAVIKVAQSQIGQAIARRINGKGAADSELGEEVHELREQVAALEQRIAESEERLDFSERLLVRGREGSQPNG